MRSMVASFRHKEGHPAIHLSAIRRGRRHQPSAPIGFGELTLDAAGLVHHDLAIDEERQLAAGLSLSISGEACSPTPITTLTIRNRGPAHW